MLRPCILLVVLFICGCTAIANSPAVVDQLQLRSAGFTGCAVETNVITNVKANLDGSGSWNATCRDKVYLCSQGSSQAPTYSCAVAVN